MADYQEAYMSLTKSERDDIDSWSQIEKKVLTTLEGLRYEIENHLTAFDWLKMYSKVLEVKDFNEIIERYHYSIQQMKAKERQDEVDLMLNKKPEFEFVRPTELLKSRENWGEIKEFADFLTDFFKVQQQMVSDQVTVDLEQYMMSPTDGRTIFERAMADRNQFLKERNSKEHLDEERFVKDAIIDFDSLQSKKVENNRLREEIRASAATKPLHVRRLVDEILTNERSYVDLNRLSQRLASNNLGDFTGLINTERLMNDLRNSPRSTVPHFDRYLAMPTDILSLDEVRSTVQQDESLSETDRANAIEVVEHVSQALQTLSND